MGNMLESLSQNIVIDKSKCVFCSICAETCLLDNIRLKLSPCRQACPLSLNCQGYVQLIARGEQEKALKLIRETLPFPGTLGRICHHPCETVCKRKELDGQPVALRELKRFLADKVNPSSEEGPGSERQEKVAIVGGGPAGAMAAYLLRRQGYKVVIFEASGRLGGIPANCIPEFRLPAPVVVEEFGQLEKIGVEVCYNTTVGRNVSLADLIKEYDAVIIAIGAQVNKRMGIEGEEAQNVYGALDFLRAARSQAQVEVGRRVVVIGGGNTAIDAAQTAYRLGADDVRVLCLEARDAMPAFPWEVRDALDEGIIIDNGWGPDRFILDNGRVTGVDFKRCVAVFDKEGRFSPSFAEGERQRVAADTVIIAIGQETDLSLLGDTGIETTNSCITTDPVTMQTNIAKVFAAGDVVSGPKSVIEALAQGREAAESVHRYFQGLPLAYGRDRLSACEVEFAVDFSKAVPGSRVQPRKLEGSSRRSFKEIESSYDNEQALLEAGRCLSCGEPFGKYRTCWSCLACEVECPEEALRIEVPYLMR